MSATPTRGLRAPRLPPSTESGDATKDSELLDRRRPRARECLGSCVGVVSVTVRYLQALCEVSSWLAVV